MLAAIVSAKLDSLKPSEIPRVSVDSVHKDSGSGAPKRLCHDDDSISLTRRRFHKSLSTAISQSHYAVATTASHGEPASVVNV